MHREVLKTTQKFWILSHAIIIVFVESSPAQAKTMQGREVLYPPGIAPKGLLPSNANAIAHISKPLLLFHPVIDPSIPSNPTTPIESDRNYM